MRLLVAVSGGVDSVVLLDKLVVEGKHDLVIAHFDHGIRIDSDDDARFVQGLSRHYRLPFVSKREELGAKSSEELARTRRYEFLRYEAKKYDATIVTAHHCDDVIETIAINISRGTGWRGLAVLNSPGVIRPMRGFTKKEILDYAQSRRLEWLEDSTNATDDYLRNRLRRHIGKVFNEDDKQRLYAMWRQQLDLTNMIDEEVARHISETDEYSRYFFTNIDLESASELVRAAVMAKKGLSPTRPRIRRALIAIKTAKPGTICEVGSGVSLYFTQRTFIVRTP